MVNKNMLLGKVVAAGYTQRSLAVKIGVFKNTLNNKINGKTSFKTDEIEKICHSLNIISNIEKSEIFLSCSSQ